MGRAQSALRRDVECAEFTHACRQAMSDTIHQPIVVTHDGGVRFAAQIRSHRVVVDQPERAGGDDSGPMPLELLGAALGTCIAYYVQQFLQARALPTSGLRVEVEQHKATNPYRIGLFVVRVVPPAGLAPGYSELLERVARSCPAHATLAHEAQVLVTIEAPEAVAA
jgi:putative redox protein